MVTGMTAKQHPTTTWNQWNIDVPGLAGVVRNDTMSNRLSNRSLQGSRIEHIVSSFIAISSIELWKQFHRDRYVQICML